MDPEPHVSKLLLDEMSRGPIAVELRRRDLAVALVHDTSGSTAADKAVFDHGIGLRTTQGATSVDEAWPVE